MNVWRNAVRLDSSFLIFLWKLQLNKTKTNPALTNSQKNPEQTNKKIKPSISACLSMTLNKTNQITVAVTGSQLNAVPLMRSRVQTPHTREFFSCGHSIFSQIRSKEMPNSNVFSGLLLFFSPCCMLLFQIVFCEFRLLVCFLLLCN